MYRYGAIVYVRSLDKVGTVVESKMCGEPRKVYYLIAFYDGDHSDYWTESDNLCYPLDMFR